MTYWFRINVSVGRLWEFSENELQLNIESFKPLNIRSYDTRYNLNDQRLWGRRSIDKYLLEFESVGYKSEDEANSKAELLCHALVRMAGRSLGLDSGFIDLLNNCVPWTIGKGQPHNPSVRGYYGGGNTSFNSDTLEKGLAKYLKKGLCTKEQIRAISYVANASFRDGIRTSLDEGMNTFLAKVAAIECIAPGIEKNQNIRRFLDEKIAELDEVEYLTGDDRSDLKTALSNAKSESISTKCASFVTSHERAKEVGPQADDLDLESSLGGRFKRAYRLRSNYMHGSKGPEEGVLTLQTHDTARQCGLDVMDFFNLFVLDELY